MREAETRAAGRRGEDDTGQDAAKIEQGAEPIPRETQEKAKIYIMAAIDEKLKKAA